MNIHQTEYEQIEAIKAFWVKYGRYIMTAVVCIGLVFAGARYYQHHKQIERVKAAELYFLLQQGIQTKDTQTIKTQAILLKTNYANTPYAGLAGLMLAKLAVNENNYSEAETELTWVMKNACFDLFEDVARARLAKIQLAKNELDKALETLGQSSPKYYRRLYEEIRGDIYAEKNQNELAKAAYEQAMQASPLGAPVLRLQLKMQNLETTTPTQS